MEMMPFSEIAEINPKVKLEKGAVFPFVEMAMVEPGRRYVDGDAERVMKSGGAKFESGDILFARITPCLENGKIAQYKNENNAKAFGSTEFFVLRAKAEISDPSFIYYLSLSDYIRGPAEKSMSGASGRQRADVGAVREALVPNIPFAQQVQIGQILSAYDDLIENNTCRIKILEEMAQAIYREWFVKFRFPDHKKVKMIDSPLGQIPEGWGVKRASDAIEINPRTKVPKDGEKPFVPMGSLSTDSMIIGQVEIRAGNSGSKFKNGDTLFARITPCLENGKTGYVQFLSTNDDAGFGSTEFIVLRSKTLCPQFVYLMSRTDEFRGNAIKSMTGASGRQRVQVECFDKFLFPHPNQQTLSAFSDAISPLFCQIDVLARKNVVLRNARDLLLPRLVSGDINVCDTVSNAE